MSDRLINIQTYQNGIHKYLKFKTFFHYFKLFMWHCEIGGRTYLLVTWFVWRPSQLSRWFVWRPSQSLWHLEMEKCKSISHSSMEKNLGPNLVRYVCLNSLLFAYIFPSNFMIWTFHFLNQHLKIKLCLHKFNLNINRRLSHCFVARMTPRSTQKAKDTKNRNSVTITRTRYSRDTRNTSHAAISDCQSLQKLKARLS